MQGHRRRRVTKGGTAIAIRPKGYGGGSFTALVLLDLFRLPASLRRVPDPEAPVRQCYLILAQAPREKIS